MYKNIVVPVDVLIGLYGRQSALSCEIPRNILPGKFILSMLFRPFLLY